MEINMEFKYFVSFPIFCCRYFFCFVLYLTLLQRVKTDVE